MTCSRDGCHQPVLYIKHGLCLSHYKRMRRGRLEDCAYRACARPSYKLGLCRVHHAKRQREQLGNCLDADCERSVVVATHRLCDIHYRKQRESLQQECSHETCDRSIFTVESGLCPAHYAAQRDGRPLGKLKRHVLHRDPLARDSQDRKCCSTCESWVPTALFPVSRSTPDGLTAFCKQCARYLRVQERYGLTRDELDALRLEQDYRCKICGIHEVDSPRPLYVDHDHAHCGPTGGCPECVRGLLCARCNQALGLMCDSAERFLAAAEYLQSFSARRAAQTLV